MSQFERAGFNFKESMFEFFVFLVRAFTGALIGLTIALTAQNLAGIGMLPFMFIVIVSTGLVTRISRGWGLLPSVILLLVFLLIGVLLKLYIHTAAVG